MKNIGRHAPSKPLMPQLHIANINSLHKSTINWLHPDEEHVFLLKKRKISQQQYLASRFLTKYLYIGENKAQWQEYKLAYSEHQQCVCLTKNAELINTFSLSHSGQWVALLECRYGLGGVDIQIHNKTKHQLLGLSGLLSDLDRPLLNNNLARFYRLWSTKEAFAKLRGKSIFDVLATPHYAVWRQAYMRFLSYNNQWDLAVSLDKDLSIEVNFWEVAEDEQGYQVHRINTDTLPSTLSILK
ncbi:hypothetical protein QX776_06900 [Alteromonadaceae bacterium BrNp21-10]|nr:hypothetical protein [Alteromonadaceae bacterium BrNp21-10]